jgi:putative FmdB family regulatory protein
MPTYEYECPECGYKFEKFESITAKPKAKCPECGARCRRLISAGVGVIYKGSGFYTTDYRSESYKKAAKKESEAAGTGGDKKTKSEKKD